MNQLLYISKGELFWQQEERGTTLACQAIEKYKSNLREISQRKEWKTKGAGALFMGLSTSNGEEFLGTTGTLVSDAVFTEEGEFIYSALLDTGTAIYSKPLSQCENYEGLILRKNDLKVYDMAYDQKNNRLAIAASTLSYDRHIAILGIDSAHIDFLTEGDSLDGNPYFDPKNPDQLYYDSCGFAYGEHGNILGVGAKEICRLNLQSGALDTILENNKFDFIKPQVDLEGNLYFIQKPYHSFANTSFSFKNLLLAPVKIIKALVGWLDFFTTRYAGESLKTTGANPAKMKQKSEEEIFIEGNLINAQKTLTENQKSGEKFPGIAPKSWELMKMTRDGKISSIKKGVLAYRLSKDDEIFYSNGKHLIKISPQKSEELICEANLITKIIYSESVAIAPYY